MKKEIVIQNCFFVVCSDAVQGKIAFWESRKKPIGVTMGQGCMMRRLEGGM